MRAMAATIDKALRFWARDRSEQTAIRVGDDSLGYAALDAWVGRVAARVDEAGIAPGDRVGFYAETSLEWCVAALAAIRCGAIVAPINSRMVPAEVDYLFDQYAPGLIFVDDNGAERLAGSAAASAPQLRRGDVAALRNGVATDLERECDADAPAAIITTSGSTARPKGVVYSHRVMIEYAWEEYVHNAPDIGGGVTKLLTAAPLSTAGGFNLMIHMIVIGGSVFLLEKFDPAQALRLLLDHRINTFRAAPIFFQRIAELPEFASADLSCVRVASIGGAAPPPWLQQAWWDRGVVLRQLYGQTEAGGGACVNPVRFAKSHPDRCGFGGPFTEIAIVDDAGNRVPPNTPGQIIVRKPGIMTGYWRNPEATKAALVDGWLHTGDIGEVDENGLLKMVDRMKDFIKSGGLNISSAELERVIMEVDGVDEVAILAVPDEHYGETPFAIVHGPNCAIPAILDHCRAQLSGFKLPRYILVSPEPLPRLAMGKISKPALRETYSNRPLPEPVR
ncbi:class I adenylate-forming enzyme family protein [Sphingosinithalassobacter portus]|uniref:class I adenylate-forming enzyme family protein n=1 Tax=Stakelama portus TaxID=2676234 RepID=UPI000D6E8608|nr:AMP-binding protein [Sphingosinithalassobacter portus]